MSLRLNQQKQWRQSDSGESYGNIRGIWGCDLEYNPGTIRIAPGLRHVAGTILTGFPAAYVYTDAGSAGTYQNWVLSDGAGMVKDSGGNLSFTADALANSPTAPKYDMAIFTRASSSDNLLVPTATDIFRLNNGAWTANFWTSSTALAQTAMSSDNPHPILSFTSQYGSFCFIADGNAVHSINTNLNSAGVVKNRVQINAQFQIISLEQTPTKIFISTRNLTGQGAQIVEYDPINEVIYPHNVSGSIVFGVVVKDGIPYAIDDAGILYRYTGSGFTDVGKLPINQILNEFAQIYWTDGRTPNHAIHHRGMANINDMLHILLNSNTNVDYWHQDFPAGIYVFNETTGNFYPKYRIQNGNDGERGQGQLRDVGFVQPYNQNSFLAGFQSYGGNATGIRSLVGRPLANPTSPTQDLRGIFQTPKIYAKGVQDRWNALWMIFKKFENVAEQIVVKYRIIKRLDSYFNLSTPVFTLNFGGTWTGNTTFVSTDTNATYVAVGDEVIVFRGSSGGSTMHVGQIYQSGSDFIIHTDDTVTTSADSTSRVIIDDWKKLGTFSSTNPPQYNKFPIDDVASEWVEFKVELRGSVFSPEIDDLIIDSTPYLEVK